jgi:hypothetical protein
MWRTAAFIACAMLAGGVAHAQPAEGAADDDLAVVKRAVAKDEGVPEREAADEPRRPAVERGEGHRLDRARWFRVRIEESKGARVRVNVPLALVRGLGDDVPFDWGCKRGRHRCRMSLTEVLDLLDEGQDLVEIKDANATIRIWVD